jgi:hypothetical protein
MTVVYFNKNSENNGHFGNFTWVNWNRICIHSILILNKEFYYFSKVYLKKILDEE